MRVLVFALVLLLSVGCTTSNPNLFSGKAVIQFDQAAFFVTYLKVSMTYAVFKYQLTQACTTKILPAETCASLDKTDQQIQRIAEEINTALQNPQYPLDLNKVQQFIDIVLTTMVRVGVKGISGGIIP